jgi:enoyl-CoA hydratase/carnithine racemase
LEIALCCDLRVASSGSRFRVPAGRLGLGYGYDDVALLVDRLGADTTAEILFTASIIDSEKAEARGIVHSVFADEVFTEQAETYLGSIAANAPLVLKAVKRALLELEKPKHERDLVAVEKAAAACMGSRDYLEGQAAFREKREPRFTGE